MYKVRYECELKTGEIEKAVVISVYGSVWLQRKKLGRCGYHGLIQVTFPNPPPPGVIRVIISPWSTSNCPHQPRSSSSVWLLRRSRLRPGLPGRPPFNPYGGRVRLWVSKEIVKGSRNSICLMMPSPPGCWPFQPDPTRI